MKKISIAVIVLMCCGMYAAYSQNIPNPGLENWNNNALGYEEPDSWVTPNYLSIPIFGNPVCVIKTSPPDVHSGTHAARINTIELSNNPAPGTLPDTIGTLFAGYANPAAGVIKFGYTYYGRPSALSFYYKYTPMPNDTAYCFVQFTYWDPISNSKKVVGTGQVGLDTLCSNFLMATTNVTYTSAAIPDTAIITFTSSAQNIPIPGSSFYVDDMLFADSPPTVSKVEPDTIYWDAAASPAPIEVSTTVIAWNDSSQLAGATVMMDQNFVSAEDVLEYSTVAGITGSYSSGTLTLSGNATFANYQTALRSVKYKNSSATPTCNVRTVKFTVTDGTTTSNSDKRYIQILNTTGIQEESKKAIVVKLFPNPAHESVTISCAAQEVKQIQIYNVQGKKMDGMIWKKSSETIPTASYPSGIYFVKMMDEKGSLLKTEPFSVVR